MTGSGWPGPEQDLGTLERGDGVVTLRYTRQLPHPPAKVWRALTQEPHLAAWFPSTVEGELTAGTRLRFSFRDLTSPPMDGEVISCDPPRLLEFDWGGDLLRFELTADAGGTALVLTASFTELGKAARDGAGWHACLDLLGCALAGQPAPGDSADRWRQVIGPYRARFGPDASAVGPPPEWEDVHGLT
jgi:uncharacterized protein YndB with AHSA1/START domain